MKKFNRLNNGWINYLRRILNYKSPSQVRDNKKVLDITLSNLQE